MCFVFAKCQNIDVFLLQGYVTLNALKKTKIGKWHNTLEKRKRFGWCWGKRKGKKKKTRKKKRKKKERMTLHHTAGKFCYANSQPEVIQLYCRQTCSNAITVSLTVFMRSWASLETITWKTILGKREKNPVIIDGAHVSNLFFECTLESIEVNTEEWRECSASWF